MRKPILDVGGLCNAPRKATPQLLSNMKDSGLLMLEIEITHKCNLFCEQCYVEDTPFGPDIDKPLMKRLLDEAETLTVHDVIFTGGEPLLNKDFAEYSRYAQNRSYRLGLTTNGLLIDETNLDIINLFDFVQLSLDTPPKISGTRVDIATTVIEKTKILKKIEMDVGYVCTLSKSNIIWLEEIIDIATDLEVPTIFNTLIPVGRGRNLTNLLFTGEEMEHLLSKLYSYSRRNKFVKVYCPQIVLLDKERQKRAKEGEKGRILGGCIAGIAGCSVVPSGDVYPCPFVRISGGNVKERSLGDVWFNSDLFNRLRDRYNLSGKCSYCEYKYICGGCRALAHFYSGDLFASPICFKKS